MKDEIKEILDFISDRVIEKEKWNKVKDYITNLQEENEKLKEENKHIFANVNDDQLLISNAMNWAEAQDYKSRIDKAIDFFDGACNWLNIDLRDNDEFLEVKASFFKELLNILKGDK